MPAIATTNALPAAMTVASCRHFPQSTYRIQFHAGFKFEDARRIVPYLKSLGITHIYASPILKARAGSTHGYDVIDPHSLNPELGSDEDFAAYIAALKTYGLEQILDIVPNHMGVVTNDNAWWNDVLENGPGSRYAGYFDITRRDASRPGLHDKLVLPVLGEPYKEALEQGKLRLIEDKGRFFITYYDRRFPISPGTSDRVVRAGGIDSFNGVAGDGARFDLWDELLAGQFYRLVYWRAAPEEINYRRFFDINDLAALCMEKKEVFNDSHRLIFQLLREEKISGLRIDHPDGLFDPAQYLRRLQQEGLTNGDGKTTPYVVVEKILAANESLPVDWPVHGTTGYDFINKINGLFVDPASETGFTHWYAKWVNDQASFDKICYRRKCLILTTAFPVELRKLAHQLEWLTQRKRDGRKPSGCSVVTWPARPCMRSEESSSLENESDSTNHVAGTGETPVSQANTDPERDRRTFAFSDIQAALHEVIACFPVYRTYIADGKASDVDRRDVESAIGSALERNPQADPSIFDLIRDVLLKSAENGIAPEYEGERRCFAGKFQQLTAPVTAKGIEDTAFYIYNRLVSLNEVGGDPAIFGISPAALHQWMQQRAANWPLGLSPLSTHDTKRSEDVRARLNVLSELPDEWWPHVEEWNRMNGPHRREVDGKPAPTPNDECLLYQTLIGAWPFESSKGQPSTDFVRRIQDYMRKAMREAKTNTSWTEPNSDYEAAVNEYVAAILSEAKSPFFLQHFRAFQRRVSHFGLLNSLSQTLLRLTAPGVPDTYQGTELWDLSLVDPDNRRPVDYAHRRQMLDQLMTAMIDGSDRVLLARELIAGREDGRIKMFAIWQCLTARRECSDLFTHGEYIPVEVAGSRKDHVFSFIRQQGDHWGLVVVPSLITRLVGAKELPVGLETWQDTRLVLPLALRSANLRDRFTGELIAADLAPDGLTTLRVADLLHHLPIALLMSQGE